MYKKHIEKRRNIDIMQVCRRKRKAEQDYLHMKNKKNDGKYVIIDDGTAGGLFLSENEYYVDENKKVVLCNSEKKDNLFRKRYKLTHGDKCYSIIKYFCPEVEFISIKIMETGERGSIDSFKAALEWCLKEKIKLVHMSVGTTNYIDAKKIENIIKQMVSNKMILCAALSNTNFPTWPACFDGVFGVRNYIAKLQEKEISVSKSFPLVLQVTQKCNLRCSYCVYSGDYKNRNHSQKEMSWETAKEAVDYLYGHSMSSEDIYISFYGGEPLLMFRLIKEVVEYVKREYCQRTVHFNLTTNGTLFTPEIVQYFIKNNIQIMFSLDGPKEVHDKNRIFAGSNRGSFEKLRDSMKMIYSMDRKYYKKNVSFNTVLDPQNELRTIYEFLDKDRLISKNLSRISVLNDNYTDKQCEFSGEFVEEQEYEYFKCFLSKLKRINEKFVARAVKEEFDNEMREIKQHEEKMQEEISKVNHHSGPCIPGAKKIFVTAEGNIYPCERVSEISEVSKIGDIKKGIDKNKVLNLLNIERYSQDRCKDCWAYQHCTICIACADDTKNISNKEIEKHCWKVRGGFEEAMKNYCTLKELGYKFEEYE